MNPAADQLSQLQKYECDICNKAKQIAGLKDCLIRCQHNLNEKTNEAFVLEQKYSKLCSEYNAIQQRLKEYEGGRNSTAGLAMGEQRAENPTLAQELRRNQDALQQKHQDMVAAQQSLIACDRELARTRQEYDDLRNYLAQRDSEIKRLSEENSCLANKVTQFSQRLEIETEMKCRLEKENAFLQNRLREMEDENALLMQNLSTCQRQLSGVDNGCAQKIDQLTRLLEDFKKRLAEREDQLQRLQNRLREMEENNAILVQNLTACQRQQSGADNGCIQKIDQLTRQLEELRNMLAEREDQIQCFQNRLREMEENNAILKQNLTACQRKQSGADNGCIQKIDQLTRQLEELRNMLAEREDQIQCFQNRLREMEENNAILKQNLTACQRKQSGADNECAQKIDQLTRQLEELKNILAEREVQIQRLQNRLREMEENNAILVQNLTACQRQQSGADNGCIQKIDQLTRQLEELKNILAEREVQIQRLQNRLREMEENNAILVQNLTACQRQQSGADNGCIQKIDQLTRQLEELRNMLAEREDQIQCFQNRQREMEENNAILKQNLTACQRQQPGADNGCAQKIDQLTRQLEDLRTLLAEREDQIQCLLNQHHEMEENNNLLMQTLSSCRQLSGADNGCSQKVDQLARQLEELRNILSEREDQIQYLQSRQQEMEEKNALFMQSGSSFQHQQPGVYNGCAERAEQLTRQLEDLSCKLAEREDQIARYRDCLSQRDMEISQLKTLLCSSSRCGDNCSNNHCSSDIDSFKQEKMNSLKVSYPVGGSASRSKNISPVRGSASRSKNISNKKWTLKGNKNFINILLTGSMSKKEPDCQISRDSSTSSARNNIGATEVQERLRSNQIRQIEIERQLKCLEEEIVEDTPRLNIFQAGVESEPVQS